MKTITLLLMLVITAASTAAQEKEAPDPDGVAQVGAGPGVRSIHRAWPPRGRKKGKG